MPPVNAIQLTLSLDEINQILEALGQQPYVRVHELIAKIHQQAMAQLRNEDVQPGQQTATSQHREEGVA